MEIGSIKPGNIIIKVLTTNDTSITLLTEERFEGKVLQPGAKANRLLGEHGLAMSIEIIDGENRNLYMLDFGGLGGTIVENSNQLEISIGDVDKIILSHGHFDHFGSMSQVIPLLKEGCEIIVSPDGFQQFYGAVTKSGETIPAEELAAALKSRKEEFAISRKLPLFNKTLFQNLATENKIEITETSEPIKLTDGVITSGQIELFDEDEVTKGLYIMKSRKEFEMNLFRAFSTSLISA